MKKDNSIMELLSDSALEEAWKGAQDLLGGEGKKLLLSAEYLFKNDHIVPFSEDWELGEIEKDE